MDAVSQWRYEPPVSNGKPVEAKTTISIGFSFPGRSAARAGSTGGPPAPRGGNTAAPPVCPDWAARFDQIDDPIMLNVLREQSKDWTFDSLVGQGLSYQQQIASAEEKIAGYRAAYERDEQVWKQLGVGPKPTMTSDDCLRVNPEEKSAMAAVCDQNLQKARILMAEGMIDLLRCRAGLSSPQPATATLPRPASAPADRK